ncbi:hypothetical protein JW756_02100 [Candidatus Woesearchaeota archaeon]|nr:hypothetical protein [Candidatus Woesearchaeota archaeon]
MGKKFTDYVHPNYMIFAIFLGFLGVLLMLSPFGFAKLMGFVLLILVLITLIIVSKDIRDEKLPLRKEKMVVKKK